jgi:hypothetical protein
MASVPKASKISKAKASTSRFIIPKALFQPWRGLEIICIICSIRISSPQELGGEKELFGKGQLHNESKLFFRGPEGQCFYARERAAHKFCPLTGPHLPRSIREPSLGGEGTH